MNTQPASTTLTDALRTALSGITVANGYRLDLASTIHVGMRQINELEAPCLVLTPGNEAPGEQAGQNGHVEIQYSVSGYLNRTDETVSYYTADPDAEFALIDAIIADVRDAIEGGVCALTDEALAVAYQGARRMFHEAGGELCGAELRYLITTPWIDYLPGQ
ncbi:MAG: hypothetical protein WBN07_13940 [Woeseiaceae bacterium]